VYSRGNESAKRLSRGNVLAISVARGYQLRASTQATVTIDGLVFRLRERRVGRRALVCLVTYVVALLLVALPNPFGVHEPTATETAMRLLVAPASGHMQGPPGSGFVAYFQVAGILALIVSQPVFISQLLALVSPTSAMRRRLLLTTFAMLVSGTIGLLFGYILVLPVAVVYVFQWNPIEIQVQWQLSEYLWTVATLVLYFGLIFELPALLAGLVWLGAVSRRQLDRCRKYALVLALVASALVTPTQGISFQLAVAIPTYLLFELGLLLARLPPSESARGSAEDDGASAYPER
jgi:Sec-independent protein secretion pathway component TatC